MSVKLRPIEISGKVLAEQAVKAFAIEAASQLRQAKEIRQREGRNVPFSGERTHTAIAHVLINKARTINASLKTIDDEIDHAVWGTERQG